MHQNITDHTHLHAMLMHLNMVFVHKHSSGYRMGLVLIHKSVFLCLSASFLPTSVRYGSRSKLQQRWFSFSLSSCFVQLNLPEFLHSFLFSDFVLCLFLPLSLSLSVLLTNWAIAFWEVSHHPAARCSLSMSAHTHARSQTHAHIRVLRHPFPLFSVCLFPRSASIADFVFFFCLISMFSDSED